MEAYIEDDILKIDYGSEREARASNFGCTYMMFGVVASFLMLGPLFSWIAAAVVVLVGLLSLMRRSRLDDYYEVVFSERCIYRVEKNGGSQSRKPAWYFEDLSAVALCADQQFQRNGAGPRFLYGLELIGKDGRRIPFVHPYTSGSTGLEATATKLTERLTLPYLGSQPERRVIARADENGKMAFSREGGGSYSARLFARLTSPIWMFGLLYIGLHLFFWVLRNIPR